MLKKLGVRSMMFMNIDEKITKVITWLVAGAPPPSTFEKFVGVFSERLFAAGVPIASVGLYKYDIHPIFPAVGVVWSIKRGVWHLPVSNALVQGQAFQGGPQAKTILMQRMLRFKFDDEEDDSGDLTLKKYRVAGYTDLICLPLFNVDGSVSRCMFFGTKTEKGFDNDIVMQLRRLQAPVARVCEHFGYRSDMTVSLTTYLGQDIGRKVLDGKIQRGEGETISAVILFVDLVSYTAMSNSRSGAEVLKVLNAFYEIIDTAVVANYGEILKFIGDGALIIFPVVDDLTALEAAAQNALNAVSSSRTEIENYDSDTPIEFRASLHIGEIFYGNVGSRNRLDFTAIGPAVNLASRLLDQASVLNAKTVCSEEFNAITSIAVDTGTKCDLKGFNEAVSVFIVE